MNASGEGAVDLALFTDLYELTMLQAYHDEGIEDAAVFSLFVRDLPPRRNFLLAAGLDDVLGYLESLAFSATAIEHLDSLGLFSRNFLDSLAGFRFTGEVHAMPEGTPVFTGEPLLEVEAPMPQAQLIETFVLNQVTFQTLIASKGARAVAAAQGRPVIDFGTRRTHGIDAGLKAARSLYLAGFAATSNVEAGRRYGIPTAGTMAHSFVQAHDHEIDAFRAFVRRYPEGILLVDTYDVAEGVRQVIRLARELGDDFRVRALRLDSGDLETLARQTRAQLDEAGLHDVGVVVSGGLDEHSIEALVRSGAPIASYAAGTSVGVSADEPKIDTIYKLVAYADRDRLKLSPGKATLPGRKQVFRRIENGEAVEDTIAGRDEACEGAPLLQPVMRNGERLAAGRIPLVESRRYTAEQIAALPQRLLALDTAAPAYPVRISDALRAQAEAITATLRREGIEG